MTKLLLCLFVFGFSGLAQQVKLPPFHREVLPNGVVLYLLPKPGAPLVDFRIIVKGGGESDPADLAGISSEAAKLLRKGTITRTAEKFSLDLDSLGGTFGTAVNAQATVIRSEFLKKDFLAGLDLTTDAVLHPTFPAAEVTKTLSLDIDQARAAKDNPQAAIRSYFSTFFYGAKHPYGHPADEISLRRISRENIVDSVKRSYTGKNIIVIVSGEFDEAVAKAAVRDKFQSIPSGNAYVWAKELRPLPGNRLLLIDKPDATQTYFEIAQPGTTKTDPERTTLLLLNTLFGGRFTSMLNEELRVNSGLTYGASCRLDLNHQTGAISIASYTKTETTEKAIDLAIDVLKRFHDKGISAEQLTSVKAYVKGTYPPANLETADQLAGVLGDIELFGLNKGEVDDFFSRIDSVTLEQANAVAKRRYAPDNLTFVILGNASKVRDTVKKYAPSVKEVGISQPGYGAYE